MYYKIHYKLKKKKVSFEKKKKNVSKSKSPIDKFYSNNIILVEFAT